MKSRNKKGNIEFIADHVFWVFIGWLYYKNTLFRCFGTYSLTFSLWILALVLFVSISAGIFLQMNRHRSTAAAVADVIAGYGIYTVLVYLPVFGKPIRIPLILAAALSVGYACLAIAVPVFLGEIKNKQRYEIILRRRITKAAIGARNIMCAALAVIMVQIGAGAVLGNAILKPSVPPVKKEAVEDQTIANNIETLARIRPDTWQELSEEEKLNVLQTIANIEQRYLGLPHELNVGAANLDENLNGCYSDRRHEIIVNMDSLLYDDSHVLVNTIAHEAHHALAYRMADAYNDADEQAKGLTMFNSAAAYQEEFANYKDGKDDFCGYYSQRCESDAREYAQLATEDYFARVEEYLNGE